MFNHYFDDNGVYTLTTEAYADSIQAPDCIRSETLLDFPPGQWPVLNTARTGFVLVEDHRGREVYVGGERRICEQVGPLPEGWSDIPPIMPDTKTANEKREADYQLEADPLSLEAQRYMLEAEGLRLSGDLQAAAVIEEKANSFLKQYAAKKAEIRLRHPDAEAERYRLNASGTYHTRTCSYAGESGELLTLAELKTRGANVKPCSRCGAALKSEGADVE